MQETPKSSVMKQINFCLFCRLTGNQRVFCKSVQENCFLNNREWTRILRLSYLHHLLLYGQLGCLQSCSRNNLTENQKSLMANTDMTSFKLMSLLSLSKQPRQADDNGTQAISKLKLMSTLLLVSERIDLSVSVDGGEGKSECHCAGPGPSPARGWAGSKPLDKTLLQ